MITMDSEVRLQDCKVKHSSKQLEKNSQYLESSYKIL